MMTKLFCTLVLLLAFFNFVQSQNYWALSNVNAKGKEIISKKVAVTAYNVYTLDLTGFTDALQDAPMRGEVSKGNELFLNFPDADGQILTYNIVEAPVLHPDLGAVFPDIKSYAGQGVEDPTVSIRFSVSAQRGLYGMIFNGAKGTNLIDPYSTDLTEYMVYSKSSMVRTDASDFVCTMPDEDAYSGDETSMAKATNDKKLRKYRLALCCNAEYGNLFVGTATTNHQKYMNILAQMNITMTRVNGVYEKDLAITMEIIPNDTLIIYFGSTNADPWTSEFNTKTAQTIDAAIGVENYDIGHNFNTSGGGNAGCIACVCLSSSQSGTHKGRGMTGRSDPTGDAFDIDYVAHEMGHQFGGYHTMNTCSRSGSGSTEVEPTSGSTIMGYAGICTYNIQSNSDDYFAYVNIRDISANVQSGNSSSCAQVINISNNAPTANAGLNYTIPKSTAFMLTGVGTDPDGNPLTYTWEQNDPAQAPASSAPVSTWTVGPMFRSIKGTTNPIRYFPNINSIVANNLTPAYEVIPSVGRTLNFSLVVRDNIIGGGQTANDLMVVTVNGTAGPFTVSAPNTAVSWAAGSTQTVTWNVSGTTAAPVSCANVDILLSHDGGFTYPDVILANTPNDGTQTITVPNIPYTTCRIMVKGSGNIFFDISNVNFTITGSTNSISSGTISGSPFCAGTAVSVPFTLSGTFNAGNVFTAQLSNATGSFTTPVNIGTLTSTTAGTIPSTIPAGTTSGTGYRIRVVSSSPVVTGTDNGVNLTVNPQLAPSVVVSASSTSICTGTSVTFTAVPSNGGTPVYQWKLNGANVGTNSATYTNAILANGNIITCNMTSSLSCVTSATVTSNSVTMTVSSAVTPVVAISASATTICVGSSVTFTATPTNGGTPSYQWKVNGSNVGTNNVTYTNTGLVNGDVVSCVMTSSLPCASVPTATSNTLTITVTSTVTPVVSISASATTICSGTSVTFTATPTNGGTPTYQWKLNGANVGTNSATYTNVALANNNVVTCVMTTSLTCTTSSTATSNSVTMTVTAAVTPTVAVAASATTICSGTAVTFTATPTNGGTPVYQWKLNGINIGSNSATYTSGTLANGDLVTCTMTTSLSCVSSTTANSNTVTMNVTPAVTPANVIAASATSICNGNAVTFNATPTNGGTPIYQWLLNGVNVGNNNATYTSNTLANGDIINCNMTSSLLCVTSPTVTSNSVTINVSLPANPAATGNTRCGTGTVALTASGSGVLHWFDAVTGGVELGTGANFTTPSISTTTTFYVEDHILQSSQYVGPLSNFAGGSYSNTSYTLNFDCYAPSTLVSVAVDKQTAGNIVIQLTTSGGTVLQTGTFAVPAGASRVTLNWPLTVATGLKLVGPANSGLWRVTTGGTFPYTLAGRVSITSCSSTTRFGSFFNWEIKDPDCISTRTSVDAIVSSSVTPSVVVSASATTICSGTSVTFTATPSNGGTPAYQWKLNGANVGTNSDTYSNVSLVNGDIVTCDMTSSLSCATTPTVTSNSVSITVGSAVTPVVTLTASSSAICSGTAVTFTATSVNGGTPSYQWQVNGSNVGTNTSIYSNSTLANADAVICIMTSSLTCASVPDATSNTVIMNVTSSVTPSVAIVADNTSICSGTSVTFTATPANGGIPTYQWKVNSANVGSNANTYINSSLLNGDVVTCVMSSSLSCTTSPNANSNAVTIIVNSTVTPLVSIAADNTTICSGTSVTFTATQINGGAAVYQWNLNGSVVGVNSSVYTNTSLINGDSVSCNMTSSLSCTTTPTVTSNAVTLTVNTTPNTSAGPDQIVCEGSSVILAGNGADTYFWNNGVTDGVSFIPSSGVFVYSVTGTSNGCSNTDQVIVTVNAVPAVSAGADKVICEGMSVTLAGTGASAYSWDNGVTNNISFIPTAGSVTYTLTGTANGCTNTDQVVVTVNPLPVVDAGIDQAVCEGNAVTLTASGAATYYWNNGVTNSTPFTPLLGVSIYNVMGVLNGCSNTDQVVVTVNAVPAVNAGVNQITCMGTTVILSGSGAASYSWDNGVLDGVAFTPVVGTLLYTLTGTTNGCSATDQVIVTVNTVEDYTVTSNGPTLTATTLAGATYQWIDCNNGNIDIPNEINENFTATENGNYAVVINQNGCSSTSACTFVNVTGILKDISNYNISIFPNPTHGTLHILFGEDLKDVIISLENVLGQKLFVVKENQTKGIEKFIDLGNYATGLYFINITNKDINLKYKILYKE